MTNYPSDQTCTAMSVFRSGSAVFAGMGESTYELQDSWIDDSGADTHI
jgi:hypothetical protein